MRIIKVSATESTNNLAKEWYVSNKDSGAVVFVTDEQTAGRGQRGATWNSNRGENLTMSLLFPLPSLEINEQFLLSAGVGLAITKALKLLNFNTVRLKWPNDIMAANKKIGGILIENILSNGRIAASVIGLGLNVNQQIFPDLPQASSLRNLSSKEYELEEVLNVVVKSIEDFVNTLDRNSSEKIFQKYEALLFKKDKISTFELKDGNFLTGIIVGVTSTGLLKVRVEDEVLKPFDLKEVKLLF
ncbi:biotin--[acetyl-CoA-carboxylase] ligase [Antarcticibacterium sp. 1MA-6-2]|uniref:biotin--[acetyl-CoA-carboxylase] ligase n=1 Tax=Antarcticibacterium sp. 1MA-6-2 TaxID=2908210 RepID=UPI001F445798|nr:biotin--[acetyl-CoA-carboxylase] ligase [Antarcticibacterium sp. 1MA-6-2]UJH91120.1 biotin--[acetyl-CoA-carboxylase] ligase [Antarcticibacterium sp. 1MA-6-2]